MVQKIVLLVSSCGECPNRGYYSGGQLQCNLVNEIIPDKNVVAPFCPLSDFPSSTIANMAATIRTLREPNKYGLNLAILSYVATKLGTLLGANSVVTIPLKNGESVYLRYDSITKIDTQPYEIHFMCDEKRLRLSLGDKPSLSEEVIREGFDEPLWLRCELA